MIACHVRCAHAARARTGYPSPLLLAGRAAGRLVLGGDHLIDSAHVWTCSGCGSCYRFYPYGRLQLWLADDAAEQLRGAARAAARGDRRAAGAGDEPGPGLHAGGGGALMQPHQRGGPGSGHGELPRYTYEL
jgi:hypothetical protein